MIEASQKPLRVIGIDPASTSGDCAATAELDPHGNLHVTRRQVDIDEIDATEQARKCRATLANTAAGFYVFTVVDGMTLYLTCDKPYVQMPWAHYCTHGWFENAKDVAARLKAVGPPSSDLVAAIRLARAAHAR